MKRISVEFYKIKENISLPIDTTDCFEATSMNKIMILNWSDVYVSDIRIPNSFVQLNYTSPTFIYVNDKIFEKVN